MEVRCHNQAETINLGQAAAEYLSGGEAFFLFGDLGSGKTTFVKGLALGLGILETITSPTYVFLRSYRGPRFTLYHLDLYRISDSVQLQRVNFEDILEDVSGIFAVEWPEFLNEETFRKVTKVFFKSTDRNGRLIKIIEGGQDGKNSY